MPRIRTRSSAARVAVESPQVFRDRAEAHRRPAFVHAVRVAQVPGTLARPGGPTACRTPGAAPRGAAPGRSGRRVRAPTPRPPRLRRSSRSRHCRWNAGSLSACWASSHAACAPSVPTRDAPGQPWPRSPPSARAGSPRPPRASRRCPACRAAWSFPSGAAVPPAARHPWSTVSPRFAGAAGPRDEPAAERQVTAACSAGLSRLEPQLRVVDRRAAQQLHVGVVGRRDPPRRAAALAGQLVERAHDVAGGEFGERPRTASPGRRRPGRAVP